LQTWDWSPEGKSMTDKADHIAWAADAIAAYQRHCRTEVEFTDNPLAGVP
jgi:hypothetical protein